MENAKNFLPKESSFVSKAYMTIDSLESYNEMIVLFKQTENCLNDIKYVMELQIDHADINQLVDLSGKISNSLSLIPIIQSNSSFLFQEIKNKILEYMISENHPMLEKKDKMLNDYVNGHLAKVIFMQESIERIDRQIHARLRLLITLISKEKETMKLGNFSNNLS